MDDVRKAIIPTQARNTQTIQLESWPTRAQAAGESKEVVACLELLIYEE